ncbi:interference hedgehog-like isoform X2 [Tachypleus tridentatus]|uniref:interference hedgehog-like isoform X2 n=2 Tax=Tachypleus tridentatus TaxID=6853 RepID=UPI003FD14AC5
MVSKGRRLHLVSGSEENISIAWNEGEVVRPFNILYCVRVSYKRWRSLPLPFTSRTPKTMWLSIRRNICFWCCVCMIVQKNFGETELSFRREPTSTMVEPGMNRAVFRCSVAPSGAKISWMLNGQFVDSSVEYLKFKDNGKKLIVALPIVDKWTHQWLAKQQSSGEDLFQCIGSYEGKSLVSRPAKLIVPELRSFPQQENIRVSVKTGNVAVIPCDPPQGVPRVITQFMFNNKKIDKSKDRYILMPSGDLQILDVKTTDSGAYQCIANNPFLGEMVKANHEVILEVKDTVDISPPVLSVTPVPTTSVVLGSNVTLECAADGNPPVEISWSKNGGRLPHRRHYQDAGNLLLFGVLEQDKGTYKCSAKNDVGLASAETKLEVQEIPVIVQAPEYKRVNEGEDAELQCVAQGYPALSITWINNGKLVSGNHLVKNKGRTLVLKKVTRQQAGIYQCFATNELDSTYAYSELEIVPDERVATSLENEVPTPEIDVFDYSKVKDYDDTQQGTEGSSLTSETKHVLNRGVKLVPPSKPNITRLSDDSVMVRWKVEKNDGLPIQFFKVQYKQAGGPWMTVDLDIPPHVWSYAVSNLQAETTYRFRIAAVYSNNDNKVGSASLYTLVKNPQVNKPTITPVILKAKAKDASTISLLWDLKETDPSVPIEGFFVHYRSTLNAGDYVKVTVLGAEKRSCNITHLAAATSYDFKMQSFNMAGASEFSNILTSRTTEKHENIFESEEELKDAENTYGSLTTRTMIQQKLINRQI